MALKVSNKNRKKSVNDQITDAVTVKKVHQEQAEFTKKFKIVNLDPVSPTFCAAKWLDATIWLSNGFSTSCHHNPLYKIDLEELKTNPSALHNTAQKRLDRTEMLEGKQPSGCQYCWKIENETNSFSDRVYKSFGIGDNNIATLVRHYLRARISTCIQ